MISTSTVVEELVKKAPFLETALAADLVNYSSLARYLRPEIEKRLLKDVKDGAIIMALNRVATKLRGNTSISEKILNNLGDITVRSNLVDYTYLNSPTLATAQEKILEKVEGRRDVFVTISHGISQVTIIANQVLENDIKEIFKNESLVISQRDLSSLTIRITEEATKTPGVLYSILKVLAWDGINLIEAVSTYTELTVVLDTKDIDRAFSLLKRAK